MEKYLTVPEVAKIFRVTEKTIRKLLRNEKIKGFKIGADWRVPSQEIERMQEEGAK